MYEGKRVADNTQLLEKRNNGIGSKLQLDVYLVLPEATVADDFSAEITLTIKPLYALITGVEDATL